jgi:hypothetical protein
MQGRPLWILASCHRALTHLNNSSRYQKSSLCALSSTLDRLEFATTNCFSDNVGIGLLTISSSRAIFWIGITSLRMVVSSNFFIVKQWGQCLPWSRTRGNSCCGCSACILCPRQGNNKGGPIRVPDLNRKQTPTSVFADVQMPILLVFDAFVLPRSQLRVARKWQEIHSTAF